jgi:poly(3-hydroxybutyrate) depolymerase
MKKNRQAKCILIILIFVITACSPTSKNKSVTITAPAQTVQVMSDSLISVVYGSNTTADGKTQSLNMNIYFPANRTAGKKYPLVMLMHGGSFTSGSKENMNSSCRSMADSGFIAVTINYRKGWNAGTSPYGCQGDIAGLKNATYRATQDAAAALRFLAEKENEYSIDMNWIFVGGSSAGAVLAFNLVYLDQEYANRELKESVKALKELDKASNTSTKKYSIKGICGMWGGVPDSNMIKPSNAVPAILYHGTSDFVIPYEHGTFGTICKNYPVIFGSGPIYRRTVAAGKAAILNTSIGGKHGPTEFTRRIMMSNTACFFKSIMNGAAQTMSLTTAKAGCI